MSNSILQKRYFQLKNKKFSNKNTRFITSYPGHFVHNSNNNEMTMRTVEWHI